MIETPQPHPRVRIACVEPGDKLIVHYTADRWHSSQVNSYHMTVESRDDVGFRGTTEHDGRGIWFNGHWEWEHVDKEKEARCLLAYKMLLFLQPFDSARIIPSPDTPIPIPDWLIAIADRFGSTESAMYHIYDMNMNVWERPDKSKRDASKTYHATDFTRASRLAARFAPILDRYFKCKYAYISPGSE